MSPLKTFIIFSIILTALALVVTYLATEFATGIHPATMTVPYVVAESVNVTGKGLIARLLVLNETGNMTLTGGYAEIIETGQSSNLRVVGPSTLEANYTLLPQYVNLSSVGIRGLISGYIYGDPMYIAFFVVSPVHVSVSVGVTEVKYGGCVLDVTINYSTPIPIIIDQLTNVTLVDDTESQYVFYSIGNIPIFMTLSPGANTTTIAINVNEAPYPAVFSCSLTPGHIYTLYMPMTVTYIYPTTNITKQLIMYKVFVWGG